MELTRNNYEEFFLLYVDRELNDADRKVVEKFVEQNPDLRKELDDLQETVLTLPEEIVFVQKETLYRKETAKLIAFPWRRIAAAAVVLLLLGSGTWLYLADSTTDQNRNSVAVNSPVGRESVSGTTPATKPVVGPSAKNETAETGLVVTDRKVSDKKEIEQIRAAQKAADKNPESKSEESFAVNSESGSEEELSKTENMLDDNSIRETQEAALRPLSDVQLATANAAEPVINHSHIAVPVAAREISAEPEQRGELYAKEPPRDNVVYIANLAVKKSSFRQAFRKASRIFDKVTTLNAPTKEDVAMLKQ